MEEKGYPVINLQEEKEYNGMTDYLIKKNPNIIVDETIKNKKIDIFRIEKR